MARRYKKRTVKVNQSYLYDLDRIKQECICIATNLCICKPKKFHPEILTETETNDILSLNNIPDSSLNPNTTLGEKTG